MSFDQDQFNADMKRRIREKQEQLRKLPDDELMRLHESIYEEPEGQRDSALMAAALREVDRRRLAAGWFWRRLLRPEEYQKWVDHANLNEVKASEQAINILQKYDSPNSQEAVRRLQEYMREKKR